MKKKYITRTLTFKNSNKKKQAKVLEVCIDKFIKDRQCKFVDYYLIDTNKVQLLGVIK